MASIAIPVERPRRAGRTGRFWWTVHQWVGLKLSVLLGFICLTGTLAVFSHEIDWLLLPSLRVAPSSVAAEPAWDRIVASASVHPRVKTIQSVSAPTASAFASRVMVVWKDDSYGYLHVHPASGRIQGEGHWVGAQRILRNMHRHLNLPGNIGIPLVSSMSFLLLISVGTSFVVYKKWWRGFLRAPRQRDARTWWGDFHRLAGVWSLWFVALIGATGVWYLVEELGANAPQPRLKGIAPYSDSMPAVGARFAESFAAARAADPALRIENVRFPTDKSGTFVFEGQKAAILVRPRANSVWTEVKSGKVLATFDAREMSAHQRISEMADPLHFGTFAGYWTKVPWFLFGALLTALSVSGAAIYGLRVGRSLRETAAGEVAARAWRGMGLWAWPALACVLIGLALVPTLFFERAG